MNDELEMMVDFEDNENDKNEEKPEIQKTEKVEEIEKVGEKEKDDDNKSKKSEFSLDISDANNISGDKSPSKSHKIPEDLLDNLNREDSKLNRGSSHEKNSAPTADDLAKKSKYKDRERDDRKKKVSDKVFEKDFDKVFDKTEKSNEKKKSDEVKDKKKSLTDPHYFILKFPGDHALNTCLDNNFIILSPGLSQYFDIIEVNLLFS